MFINQILTVTAVLFSFILLVVIFVVSLHQKIVSQKQLIHGYMIDILWSFLFLISLSAYNFNFVLLVLILCIRLLMLIIPSQIKDYSLRNFIGEPINTNYRYMLTQDASIPAGIAFDDSDGSAEARNNMHEIFPEQTNESLGHPADHRQSS